MYSAVTMIKEKVEIKQDEQDENKTYEQRAKQVHLQWVLWRESLHLLTTDRKWCLLYTGTWLYHRYRKSLGGKDCVSQWELQMVVQLAGKQREKKQGTKIRLQDDVKGASDLYP